MSQNIRFVILAIIPIVLYVCAILLTTWLWTDTTREVIVFGGVGLMMALSVFIGLVWQTKKRERL